MTYEFNQASHPANHAKNTTLNLSKIAEAILKNLRDACGGMSQISNTVIAHALFGQTNNSNVLTTAHAEIIIAKIQNDIAEYFADCDIDDCTETKTTLSIFYGLDVDKAHDEFKKNSTKDYILI